jgi:hypothetical protein
MEIWKNILILFIVFLFPLNKEHTEYIYSILLLPVFKNSCGQKCITNMSTYVFKGFMLGYIYISALFSDRFSFT